MFPLPGTVGKPDGSLHHGEVTEWFKVHAWNACVRKYREFESLLLRQILALRCFIKAQNPINKRVLSLLLLSGCSIKPLEKP